MYEATRGFRSKSYTALPANFEARVISFPSNIAEGQGGQSAGDFRQFLGNAGGAVLEVEAQILLAPRFQHLVQAKAEPWLSQSAERGRVLNRWIAALQPSRRKHSGH